jgi:Flp pilus assembly protein TadG
VPLLMLVLGSIQAGLVLWSWQVLQGAAADAARCAALNASACKNVATTPANTQAYAASAAQALGMSGVTTANVTVLTGAAAQGACGNTGANVVSVALTYSLMSVVLVPLPSKLTASSCFPLASSG